MSYKSKEYLIITLSILILMQFQAATAIELSDLLPQKSNEWVMSDSDQYYNNENLYDYIDGGAELYLSYGFNTVISRHYASPGEMDIAVEIFDMKSSREAFGAFSNMREKNQQEFGQGSQQIEGSLIFWKDHYFISITTNKNTEKSLAAIKKIAAYIDKAIPMEGKIPKLMEYLPKQDLVPEGYCYFHHYIWLNSYYFIANYNILNIGDSTDAVLAKYGPADKRLYLLLIQYQNEDTAKSAFDKFTNEFAPELKTVDAVKLKDNSWISAIRENNFVIAVFNAPNKEEAINLRKSSLLKINTP